MTWGEFKESVENSGVTDDMDIKEIDVFLDSEPEVSISGNEVTIYQ